MKLTIPLNLLIDANWFYTSKIHVSIEFFVTVVTRGENTKLVLKKNGLCAFRHIHRKRIERCERVNFLPTFQHFFFTFASILRKLTHTKGMHARTHKYSDDWYRCVSLCRAVYNRRRDMLSGWLRRSKSCVEREIQCVFSTSSSSSTSSAMHTDESKEIFMNTPVYRVLQRARLFIYVPSANTQANFGRTAFLRYHGVVVVVDDDDDGGDNDAGDDNDFNGWCMTSSQHAATHIQVCAIFPNRRYYNSTCTAYAEYDGKSWIRREKICCCAFLVSTRHCCCVDRHIMALHPKLRLCSLFFWFSPSLPFCLSHRLSLYTISECLANGQTGRAPSRRIKSTQTVSMRPEALCVLCSQAFGPKFIVCQQ